jgi:endonuclease/exonuclease/phosphatase family metal-dependent hydrolase
MTQAGYRDAFRETHPLVARTQDATWSPRFTDQEQDRIDFIYYRSKDWRASQAQVIRDHAIKFPSDHAAVVATFVPRPSADSKEAVALKAVSYNIRRGWGLDHQTNLDRTADVLTSLDADVIGLQEVDLGVNRSGQINQPYELGKRLGMHSAFGKFMDYDVGRYGMAILSRFPMRDRREVRLPMGNEPRIALAVEVVLPDDQVLTVVNVHFDWVADDAYRFAQAQTVRDFLQGLQTPYLLLGDFNDSPESRTLELFRQQGQEARKDPTKRFTFPADSPREEIDFVFAGPATRWEVLESTVVDERVASDHRPVFTRWKLK